MQTNLAFHYRALGPGQRKKINILNCNHVCNNDYNNFDQRHSNYFVVLIIETEQKLLKNYKRLNTNTENDSSLSGAQKQAINNNKPQIIMTQVHNQTLLNVI